MSTKDVTVTIEFEAPARRVFQAITDDVSKWWGGEDLSGSASKLNDEFVIFHRGAHFSRQKVVEIIADRKVVWLVTDSTLSWLTRDQQEWTNTKMIFEIAERGDKTELRFTHEGLVPEMECYERVLEGWNVVIRSRLYNLINSEKR